MRKHCDCDDPPAYLAPYLRAIERHGARFESLLWASRESQIARFEAIGRIYDFHGRSMFDAGCGRGDLLRYLLDKNVVPSDYTGLEAVPSLAAAAISRLPAKYRVLQGDFVAQQRKLFVGAEVVVFCGSLNTLSKDQFAAVLRHAYQAAGDALVFNFLSSSALAASSWLTWHDAGEVYQMARQMCGRVRLLQDYLPGDATIGMFKAVEK